MGLPSSNHPTASLTPPKSQTRGGLADADCSRPSRLPPPLPPSDPAAGASPSALGAKAFIWSDHVKL